MSNESVTLPDMGPAMKVVWVSDDSVKVFLVGDRKHQRVRLVLKAKEETDPSAGLIAGIELPEIVLESASHYKSVIAVPNPGNTPLPPKTTIEITAFFPEDRGFKRWLKDMFFKKSVPAEIHSRFTTRSGGDKPSPILLASACGPRAAEIWAVAHPGWKKVGDLGISLRQVDDDSDDTTRVPTNDAEERRPVVSLEAHPIDDGRGRASGAKTEVEPTQYLDLDPNAGSIAKFAAVGLNPEREYTIEARFIDAVGGKTKASCRVETPFDPDAPRLLVVVGDTTPSTTLIWVRGDVRYEKVEINLLDSIAAIGSPPEPGRRTEPLRLRREHDFTATCRFHSLQPAHDYRIEARFQGPHKKSRTLLARVRTFPDPGAAEGFRFLHGSCNLSTVVLTNTAALGLSGLGWMAVREAMQRPIHTWTFSHKLAQGDWWQKFFVKPLLIIVQGLLRFARRAVPSAAKSVFGLVGYLTRFEQPRQFFPSPFEQILKKYEKAKTPPLFMIHAGDQIYYDIPMPRRVPDKHAYRRDYVNNWVEDRYLRTLLARMPHYMTLDDHEIVDGFARDRVPQPAPRKDDGKVYTPDDYRNEALHAYEEYVHSRHPSRGKRIYHYDFQCGTARFFVLDTRTERRIDLGTMISEDQLEILLGWLDQHRESLKFVVTSVPFLAELGPVPPLAEDTNGEQPGRRNDRKDCSRGRRNDRNDRNRGRRSDRNDDSERGDSAERATRVAERLDDPLEASGDDKWSGKDFRDQRDRVLDFCYDNRIGRLVFLAGDMHCGYHCTARVGEPERRITVHEIAGGPFHQLIFATRGAFVEHFRATTAHGHRLETSIRAFNASALGAVEIAVSGGASPQVDWKIVPLTRAALEGTGFEHQPVEGSLRF